MDPKFQFLFLLIAFAAFVFAAFQGSFPAPAEGKRRSLQMPSLVPLGLAFWVLIPLWSAWKALG